MDVCTQDAIQSVLRKEPLVLGIDPSELEKVDQASVLELCRKARLHPDEPVCMCMITRARELAAVLLLGAKTPEEISLKTGMRTYCALWCHTAMERMLKAHGIEIEESQRHYSIDVALWNIPDSVARKYPEYRVKEDKKSHRKGMLDKFTSNFW